MARTKRQVLDDRCSSREKAEAAERAARRRAGILKAARPLSREELAALPPVKQATRAHSFSEDEDGDETEPEDDTFSRPAPEQVVKLCAQTCGGSGRYQWRHGGERQRGGAFATTGLAR